MKDRGESFKLDMDFAKIMDYILYEITYTTGTTTGLPSRFYNTTYDMFLQTWMFRIGCKITYLEPDDILMNLFPFHFIPHIGYYKTVHFASAVGMTMCWGFTGAPLPGSPTASPLHAAGHRGHREKRRSMPSRGSPPTSGGSS